MPRLILIVEDEPSFAEVLQELLIEEGYSVVRVRDGITALSMLSSERRTPDMIVCDVMLPSLRGDRFVEELRRRFPARRLPVLLMSASADPCLSVRDVWFMPKPFETGDLLETIEAILAEPPRVTRGAMATF